MTRRKMSKEELDTALTDLSGWEIVNGKLSKQFKFSSFAQAMGWMMSVAIEADKLDHHPEWSNVYNRVQVQLVTHDLGNSISTWDIELAQKMDMLAA